MEHCRLMQFHEPRTGGEVSTGTFRLYPAHYRTPTVSEGDRIILAAADLVDVLKMKQPELVRERRKHVSMLKQLMLVLNEKLPHQTQAPRVREEPSTSVNPTHPNNATHNKTRPSATHTS